MRTIFLALSLTLLGLSSAAHAHFKLVAPVASKPSDTTGGKGPPPCGPDSAAAATPTPVQGGHALHVEVNETVYHPGWYRIALSVNSRSELPPDPKVYDGKMNVLDPAKSGVDSASAEKQPSTFPILQGAAWEHSKTQATFTMELMIPNFDCPKCTLQFAEFMNQHPSNVGIGGFFYHHCADIKITADPALPLFNPNAADGGAPDTSTPADAMPDVGGTGAAGTGAAGSSAGGQGGAGTSGAAGTGVTGTAGTSGAAGTAAAGTSGTTGAAGSTGAAGTGTGAAGTGAAGTAPRESGGGCSMTPAQKRHPSLALVVAGLIVAFAVRSRRRRGH